MKPANGELKKKIVFSSCVEIKQPHAMTGPKEIKKIFLLFWQKKFWKKGVNIYMFAPFYFIKMESFY